MRGGVEDSHGGHDGEQGVGYEHTDDPSSLYRT